MATSSNITLEDLEELTSHDHLSYPAPSTLQPAPEKPEDTECPKKLLSDRLYIGNLHPSVDEYTLLRTFSKFGKVTKLDFLFHKSGPMKGKPRGFAFIEYSTDEEAHKAQSTANDKLLRGRKLVVTHAQQAPLDQYGGAASSSGSKYRKGATDVGRPTAISLIKTGLNSRQEPKTSTKIAMMEAKLRELEAEKAPAPEATTTNLPFHPSLPLKPQSSLQATDPPAPDGPQHWRPPKIPAVLPSLPMPPPPSTKLQPVGEPRSTVPKVVRETRGKLAGVVIKPKAKKASPTVLPSDSTESSG